VNAPGRAKRATLRPAKYSFVLMSAGAPFFMVWPGSAVIAGHEWHEPKFEKETPDLHLLDKDKSRLLVDSMITTEPRKKPPGNADPYNLNVNTRPLSVLLYDLLRMGTYRKLPLRELVADLDCHCDA
jgi:hypothetical protein